MKSGTKDKLLKESLKIIRKNGLKGLSIRGLTEKVGIKGSSFYEHFKNKEELLEVIRGSSLATLFSKMKNNAKDSNEPKDMLLKYGQAYISFSQLRPDEFHLLFEESKSKRESKSDEISEASPYSLLFIEFNKLVNSDPALVETYCFGYWSLVHGISNLRKGHLKDYKANFEKENMRVLSVYLDGVLL